MSASIGLSTFITPWTDGGTPGVTTTTQNSGESLVDFYARHWSDVPSGPSVAIGLSTLRTPVICDGDTEVVETVQQQGESRQDFYDRHWDAVRNKVSDCD